MKKDNFLDNQTQYSRTRHEIYINSIGRSNLRQVSCHIDKDKKSFLYEKRQSNIHKALQHIIKRIQKDFFQNLIKCTSFKQQSKEKVFLPEALLKNDHDVMRSFREKLTTGQIDRYIGLYLPVSRPKPSKQKQQYGHEKTAPKDGDSTYVDFRQKTNVSKSIDVNRSKVNVSKSIKVYEMGQGSKSRAKSSRGKNDIIHITYTQVHLDSERSPSVKSSKRMQISRSHNSSKGSGVRIKQFTLEEFCNDKRFGSSRHEQEKGNSPIVPCFIQGLKQWQSPNIAKHRVRKPQYNFSDKRNFNNIQIDY